VASNQWAIKVTYRKLHKESNFLSLTPLHFQGVWGEKTKFFSKKTWNCDCFKVELTL